MKTNDLEANCRDWNDQHAVLRQLLEKGQDHPKALEVFLRHHAAVHSKKLQSGEHWSFADELLNGLSDRQYRSIPVGGEHSVVWLIWHIARIEDITMNILLADAPQVFLEGDWQAKIGSPTGIVGNEMSPDEIHHLSGSVDLKALMAYRLAVGERTRLVVQHLNFTDLKQRPAAERVKRISLEGAVGKKAEWLLEYWGSKPSTNLLLMPATRHPFVHLNEIRRMRAKLNGLSQ